MRPPSDVLSHAQRVSCNTIAKTSNLTMLNNIALLLLLSSTLHFHFFVHAFDWYGYPTCAQPQLQLAAPPSCDTGDALTTNECLCFDTSYLTTAAQDIGSACGCSVLTTSAGVSEAYCLDSVGGTSLSAEQFIAAGGVCESPSSSACYPTPYQLPSWAQHVAAAARQTFAMI